MAVNERVSQPVTHSCLIQVYICQNPISALLTARMGSDVLGVFGFERIGFEFVLDDKYKFQLILDSLCCSRLIK